MNLSTRSRYGINAMVQIAMAYGSGPIQIKDMAEKSGTSNKYLEQIIMILKCSGLILSVRGPKGGYLLAMPPNKIKLTQLMTALEGFPQPIQKCDQHKKYTKNCSGCAMAAFTEQIQNAMLQYLDSVTLQDMVDRATGKKKNLR